MKDVTSSAKVTRVGAAAHGPAATVCYKTAASPMRTDIVVVIPAYCCAASIADVVRGARRYIGTVIVVDDGSTDRTADLARGAGATVESLPVNRGKGAALRRGLELALERAPSAVLLMDGDGQHDPEDIPALLAGWDGGRGDLVIGSRWSERDKMPGARFWTNYIGSRALSWMTGFAELEDTQSGFRLLGAGLAARLRLRSDGYAIESEMLIRSSQLGARLVFVPVRAIYGDSPSHFRPLLDTWRIMWQSMCCKVFGDP